MSLSLDDILQLITAYKYSLLFPISILEGPIVTIIAGFVASVGHMNLWIALGVVVVGDLVGDALYYFLGRWGRRSLLHRIGRYIGLPPERVEKLDTHFGKHPGKTLLFGKLTHATGSLVLVGAGMARVDFLLFLLYNFLGTVPKSFAFILMGFYFGSAYQQIGQYIDTASLWLFVIIVLAVSMYYMYRRLRRKA